MNIQCNTPFRGPTNRTLEANQVFADVENELTQSQVEQTQRNERRKQRRKREKNQQGYKANMATKTTLGRALIDAGIIQGA